MSAPPTALHTERRRFHLTDLNAFRPTATDDWTLLHGKREELRAYLIELDHARVQIQSALAANHRKYLELGPHAAKPYEWHIRTQQACKHLGILHQQAQDLMGQIRQAQRQRPCDERPYSGSRLERFALYAQHCLSQAETEAIWQRVGDRALSIT